MTAPSWRPADLVEEGEPGRPVLDDLPPWLPGGLVAAEFAAGAAWPDCRCQRCVSRGGP